MIVWILVFSHTVQSDGVTTEEPHKDATEAYASTAPYEDQIEIEVPRTETKGDRRLKSIILKGDAQSQ